MIAAALRRRIGASAVAGDNGVGQKVQDVGRRGAGVDAVALPVLQRVSNVLFFPKCAII